MRLAYSVILYDESGDRVARLENASNPTYSRSRNSADQVSLSLPRTDDKIDEIIIGRRFEILRNAVGGIPERLECSGVVASRGYSGENFTIEGFTEEVFLENYLTPVNYGYPLYSENATLDAFFDQFDRSFEVERVKYNWDDYDVEVSNVEFSTDPSYVLLSEASAGPPPVYESSGYITFRFEKTSDQEWDRIRWVSDYDEDSGVTTTIQYRQGASAGAGSFSTAEAGALTDVVGIIPADPDANFMDVRVNLATTNTAVTPRLFALEVIKRTPIPEVSSVSYTVGAASVETPGVEANQKSLLQTLIDVCDVTEWDFKLERGVLTFAESLGTSRVNDYVLIEGDSPPVVEFNPLFVANLTAWFDASDTSTITEASGSVSQWDDKSGNAYDLTQGTAANQPTTGSSTINALNALDFNVDFMQNTSLSTSSGTTTMFFVLNITDNNAPQSVADVQVLTTNRHMFQPNTLSNIIRFWGDSALYVNAPYSTWGVDTIFTIQTTGSTVSIWANGVLVMNALSLNTTGLNGFRVGTDASPSPYFLGKLGEIVIYDDLVSTAERGRVENYLASKWGITI